MLSIAMGVEAARNVSALRAFRTQLRVIHKTLSHGDGSDTHIVITSYSIHYTKLYDFKDITESYCILFIEITF